MPALPEAQRERLRQAVRSQDHLHRLVREIERLHRLVFHGRELIAAGLRASAEDIVIADVVMRHRGNFDGVYHALRAAEDGGKNWKQALTDYAAAIHAYYTTPLGMVIRKDLFGSDAQFASPSADRIADAARPSSRGMSASG